MRASKQTGSNRRKDRKDRTQVTSGEHESVSGTVCGRFHSKWYVKRHQYVPVENYKRIFRRSDSDFGEFLSLDLFFVRKIGK